jgi:formylglycine-generating enzyme required for sulfatase activity
MTNRTTFLTDETNHRVYRGGSWSFDPQSARVALRNYVTPDFRVSYLGVRLVEEIEDTK